MSFEKFLPFLLLSVEGRTVEVLSCESRRECHKDSLKQSGRVKHFQPCGRNVQKPPETNLLLPALPAHLHSENFK